MTDEYISRKLALCAIFMRIGITTVPPTICAVYEEAMDAVNKLPAADVAMVAHGRWGTGRFNSEAGNYEEQCTLCQNWSKEYQKPYCPNCGAKMDGGSDNGK